MTNIIVKGRMYMLTHFEKKEIRTDRLTVSYLEAGEEGKEPLVLIHGNTSSSLFFVPTMEKLKEKFHIFAPDLRGYGYTEKLPIDSTKGMKTWSEDIRSFMEALKIEKAHIIGWSMGGGVAMQFTIDYPNEVRSLGLINPLSPYGFSGTKGTEGEVTHASHAGTGGGLVNKAFVESLKNKDLNLENPTSAPNVLKGLFGNEYQITDELQDLFVESMLLMEIGDDFYPGDSIPASEWPFLGPGTKGVGNTMSPKYVNLTKIRDISPKPPVIWFRGAEDKIVSDTSFSDVGFLGQLGIIPGWPGAEVYPPQPMVSQTRAVFEEYAKNGGLFKEAVFEKSGHSPQIEEPEKFVEEYLKFLGTI